MPIRMIVSYDGTTNDDDALMLGRMLAAAGASLSLAYVRHQREFDPRREEIGRHDAERRLQQGVLWLGDDATPTHVVVNPSTSAGLRQLAESERADLVVFGSDYRTPPGHVEPGGSAQGLLDGGPVAVAVAAAGVRTIDGAAIRTVAIAGESSGPAAATAASLSAAVGAELVSGGREADLIIVDSQVGAPAGRVALGGTARNRLDSARGSVIVLPSEVSLTF